MREGVDPYKSQNKVEGMMAKRLDSAQGDGRPFELRSAEFDAKLISTYLKDKEITKAVIFAGYPTTEDKCEAVVEERNLGIDPAAFRAVALAMLAEKGGTVH